MTGENTRLESDRALVRALARHTRNENYIRCTLASVKTQKDRDQLIEYLDSNDNLSISVIELRVMELTGIIEPGAVDLEETLNGQG